MNFRHFSLEIGH